MPTYSAFPGYEPAKPVGSFISGLGAAEQMRYSALRSAAIQDALEQQKRQRTALETYKGTGDARELIPHMTPEQASLVIPKLSAAQMELGSKMADYWNKTKGNVTFERYPQYYNDTVTMFPQAKTILTPPEDIKTPEQFENVKWDYEGKIAQFKRMASPYMGRPVTVRPGGAVIDPVSGEVMYQQPETTVPKTYKPEAFTGPGGEVRWIQPGTAVPPGFTRGRQPAEPKLTDYGKDRELFIKEFREKNRRDPNVTEILGFKKDWEASKVKPPTPLQDQKLRQEQIKTDLLRRIGGGAAAPERQYTLPKNGVEVPVTKEVFESYMKKYGIQ